MGRLQISLLTLIALLATPASATTWIVASSGGQSMTISGIWSQDVQPGDTVEIRADSPGGTKVYYETLNPTKSGTVAAPILIKGRDGDRVALDAVLTNSYCADISASYLTIRNLNFSNAVGYTVFIRDGTTNVTVSSNYFWMQFTGSSTALAKDCIVVRGQGHVIEWNTIEQEQAPYETSNDADGIEPQGLLNGVVRYNRVTLRCTTADQPNQHNDGIASLNCTNLSVYGNTIYLPIAKNYQQGIYLEFYNYSDVNVADYGWVRVYNNLIYGYGGSYLFQFSCRNNGVATKVPTLTAGFYNNTLDAWNGNGAEATFRCVDTTNLVCENNLIVKQSTNNSMCMGSAPDASGYYPVTSDYNHIYPPAGTQSGDQTVSWNTNSSIVWYTWAQNQAAGWDAHSIGYSSGWKNPNFVNQAGQDYRLSASSPDIGAGTNLSAIFTTDITGATRTGAWDVGAYQYAAGAGPTSVFYVATNGSDSNAGTNAALPFATLERAQQAVQTNGPFASGATVYLRGGTYYRTNAFALTSADSGSSSNTPVTYVNYPGEVPAIVGGLPIVGWQTYTGSVQVTDVSTQGLSGIQFKQLIFVGQRQPLCRYPNFVASDPYGSGWAYVDGTPSDMYASQAGESSTHFTNAVADNRTWANPTEGMVFIFPRYNWWNNILPISSYDAASRTVFLGSGASYTIRHQDRYYVEGLREELDTTNEWYLGSNLLYFWPPNAIGSQQIIAPVVSNIVTLATGTSNVWLRGITFTACKGNAIVISNANQIVVAGCTLTNVGEYFGDGVFVSGGSNNWVVGNDIFYVGRHGIEINGGTATTLSSANNVADNNQIVLSGVYYKEGVGVNVTGVGNKVIYNVIHDVPRFAIYMRGQNLTVAFNHGYNAMLETDDGGLLYAENLNFLESRGCLIACNSFHDSAGWGFYSGTRETPWMGYGIYLDALTCGVDVTSNYVARSSAQGIFVNGGSDNRSWNNVIVDCLHGSGAGSGNQEIYMFGYRTNDSEWTGRLSAYQTGWESVQGQSAWSSVRGMATAPTNITYDANGCISGSNTFGLNAISFAVSTYGSDVAYRSYNAPLGINVWYSNDVYYVGGTATVTTNSSNITWANWQAINQDANSITGNPLVNANGSLAGNSPALTLGINQIPVSQIGPYGSLLRASWPIGSAGNNFGNMPSVSVGSGVSFGAGVKSL